MTSAVMNLVVGLSIVAAAKPVCSIFTSDPIVLTLAASYLYIVVPSQVLLGIGMSVEGAFAGFGHTTTPMVISVASSLFRWSGVAWVVKTTSYGVPGIWWVFALSTYIRGLGLLALLILDRKSTSS